MLVTLNKLIKEKKYSNVVQFFNDAQGVLSNSILFNFYYSFKKMRDKDGLRLFLKKAEKLTSEKKLDRIYSDWKYLSVYSFLFSKNTIKRISDLNFQKVRSDDELVKDDFSLLNDARLLEKLVSECSHIYKLRYEDEYKFVKNDPLEFFPYKYLSDFDNGDYKLPNSSRSNMKLSFVYCVKNRPTRFLLSLKSLVDAYNNYRNTSGLIDLEIIISEDVSDNIIPNLDAYKIEGVINHYVINTGLGWTRSGTLNYGIKRSTGDVVAFCDVDFIYPKDFFVDNENSILRFDFSRNILTVNCIETHTHSKANSIYSKCSPYGYMWMVDLSLTKKVGGFSEEYVGHGFEDRDFQYKMVHGNGLGIVGSLAIDSNFYVLHLSHNTRGGEDNRSNNKDVLTARLNENNFSDCVEWGEFPLVNKVVYSSLSKSAATSYPKDLPSNKKFHLAVLAHNSYHAWTYKLLESSFKKLGLESILISPLPTYQDEGVERFCIENNIDYIRHVDMGDLSVYKSLLVFNDWDKKVSNPLVQEFNKKDIPTIGLIEGINDYNDVDTGRIRKAYRSVRNLLIPGEFDRVNYFSDIKGNAYVVGIPRMAAISKQISDNFLSGDDSYVLINANFTYGVLEEERDRWISDVVNSCKSNGLSYKLSIHHADKGDYSKYIISDKSFYDDLSSCRLLVSRFSSCILEALIKKVNVLYYNYGFEKVVKFQESHGAYFCPKNSSELEEMMGVAWHADFPLDRANEFLELHAATSINSESEIARAISTIINKV